MRATQSPTSDGIAMGPGTLECERHLPCVLEALRGFMIESTQSDRVEGLWDARHDAARGRDLTHEHFAHELPLALGLEEAPAGQGLPEEHAGRT